ncbi:phage N-6-adenine-methyltransferase [Secundilactobacillus kimchicus]|uniref:phage N-6-adenine-methyltransferase n=1 Tax=Secundilactobacillus kimchicus TaxID=528209 RepID=UPI0020785795|nr:phage N-6-adenine-methyltransferase [Secundilactobacillus kimchicus]
MINPALFTSNKELWETPQEFFDNLDNKYHFTWDLAASDTNHKCPSYFTEEDNSLKQDWHKLKGNLFLNPPYGRNIKVWVEKAYNESILRGGGAHCVANPLQNGYELLA